MFGPRRGRAESSRVVIESDRPGQHAGGIILNLRIGTRRSAGRARRPLRPGRACLSLWPLCSGCSLRPRCSCCAHRPLRTLRPGYTGNTVEDRRQHGEILKEAVQLRVAGIRQHVEGLAGDFYRRDAAGHGTFLCTWDTTKTSLCETALQEKDSYLAGTWRRATRAPATAFRWPPGRPHRRWFHSRR